METHPIELYEQARDSLASGDRGGAAKLLSAALGSNIPTPAISAGVEQLLNRKALAHEVCLGLLSHQSQKTRRERG